ncbi:MAG: hypothetical protein P4L51_24000 [Puia sp.]|nr:hypothetical protein [Puia sp.]
MSKRKDRNWTIAIRPSAAQQPHKVTKIIGLNGGGFSVLAPYHKAKQGFLYKLPVDPKTDLGPGERCVPYVECVGFTASDRVKLSYHTDGFAQFSGENPGKIISGRDPATGEPKGLGLFTRPLTTPIRTGPSVGLTVFGIDDFETVTVRDNPLIFEPSDFYYRGTTPEEANAWVLSIYAFPIGVTPPVRFENGNAVLEAAIEGLNPPWISVVKLKVVHLPTEKVFLGLLLNHFKTSGSPKSGWSISGPGDWNMQQKGHVLMASYPAMKAAIKGRDSLDREIRLPANE